MTVTECYLIKLLPYILSEKIYLYFSIVNGQPVEPALCQLYRHTFVPYRWRTYMQLVQRSLWAGSSCIQGAQGIWGIPTQSSVHLGTWHQQSSSKITTGSFVSRSDHTTAQSLEETLWTASYQMAEGDWYWCTVSQHRDPLSLEKGWWT